MKIQIAPFSTQNGKSLQPTERAFSPRLGGLAVLDTKGPRKRPYGGSLKDLTCWRAIPRAPRAAEGQAPQTRIPELSAEGWRYVVHLHDKFSAELKEKDDIIRKAFEGQQSAYKSQQMAYESQQSAYESRQNLANERADLLREMGVVRLDLQASQTLAADRATQILRLEGRVNMRGVIEHVEREQGRNRNFSLKTSRFEKWAQILSDKKSAELLDCFAEQLGWNSASIAARKLAELYNSLSMNQHPEVSPERSQEIGGFVMAEDLRDQERTALKCLCRHFGLNYRVILAGHETERWPQPEDADEELGAEP